MKNYLILSILFVLATACQPQATFEAYQEIPGENWKLEDVIEFNASIPDSGQYNVTLCIRHTSDFNMANLWCFINTRSHASRQLHDSVNIKIADPDGRWLGTGGGIKNVEQPINLNPVPLPKGNVLFRIEQGMRSEELPGVKSVGIRIQKMMNDKQ